MAVSVPYAAAAFTVAAAWALAPRVAQVVPEPTDLVGGLTQYGPLGLCLALLLFGWLSPRSVTDRQDRALEKAEKQRDDLIHQQGAEVIPVLSAVQQRMMPAMQESVDAIKDAAVAQSHFAEQQAALVAEVKRLAEIIDRRER